MVKTSPARKFYNVITEWHEIDPKTARAKWAELCRRSGGEPTLFTGSYGLGLCLAQTQDADGAYIADWVNVGGLRGFEPATLDYIVPYAPAG